MNILVINAGSSSLKYQLIDIANETMLLKGICDRIGMKGGSINQKTADGRQFRLEEDMPTHKEAIELVLKALVDKEAGAISSVSEIGAVGHRVLHSGEDFHSSVVIDDEVVRICEKNAELGPLHMPGNIACIKSCREVMPGVPMVAVSEEAVKFLGAEHSRIIICHLGNGSSISAVKDGKCIDTSMGFTPLEGLIMGTRSGDIDPAAVEFMRAKLSMTPEDAVQFLNKKCGMLGISELDSDMRVLEKAIEEGNEKAALAVEAAAYRIKKYIGSFAAALGGVDAIVFTGGIGENSSYMRKLVMQDMEYLGVEFDFDENEKRAEGLHMLSKSESYVKVFVLPTNEELSIARETAQLVAADKK